MAFSINKTADFSNRLSLNDALYDQKLDAVAKIYLKLSRQLDLKFVELVELLIEKSIEYASRNFEYKEMDKITRGDAGDHAYDFLVNYRYLGRSIEQFQKITLAELSKSNENYDLPVEIVQKSLSSGQVVIAYKHFGENIFRCIIEHQNFNCHVSKAKSFSESKYELQGLIRDKQEVNRALSNSQLIKILLSEIDFNSAKEIMFHIPRSDYDLPINVLLDNEGDYIGLKYDISVLPSILPKRIKENF